ncbi:MAG: hypothetical protein O7A04_11100, partial [Acidobacteria bacterium]|nr:hypothetical protein [Acidobacteriota bacterium]
MAADPVAVDAFRISVVEDGAYRVTYEDLAAVAPIGIPDSRRLALSNRGQALPISVEDRGDGKFDAGDAFECVG